MIPSGDAQLYEADYGADTQRARECEQYPVYL